MMSEYELECVQQKQLQSGYLTRKIKESHKNSHLGWLAP